jgi:predicted transcriptional regulator of viral defense system
MPDETNVMHVRHAQCSSRLLDRRVGDLAEAQHGVVSRTQLLELGMGRGAIGDRVARGLLRRVARGVYAVGHFKQSHRSRWMAAVLSSGPGAVLSHRSAAALWGLLPPSSIAIEVTRPRKFRSRPGVRAHCSEIGSDEIALLDGIPVTSMPRTLLDLAAIVSKPRLESALNEVEVQGLTDRLWVGDLMKRYPGRRGAAVLRVIMEDEKRARGITKKELERRFAALLAGTDLPRPRRNADLAAGGRFFEVDCLWREQRLIVELDGRSVHGTWRTSERDREKDRLLLVDGWQVVRITWRQLRDDASAVVADLRSLLRG